MFDNLPEEQYRDVIVDLENLVEYLTITVNTEKALRLAEALQEIMSDVEQFYKDVPYES